MSSVKLKCVNKMKLCRKMSLLWQPDDSAYIHTRHSHVLTVADLSLVGMLYFPPE